MIEVYSWATPNGHKIHIMLEECGLPYRAIPIDIGSGAQFAPEFLAISPNNKIPAIVDPDGPDGQPISVFESGAILVYLATKTGRFLAEDVRGRFETLEWLMFQMASVGPMLGQAHHFRMYAPEPLPYAVDRYTNEAKRLYGVMDRRLATRKFIATDDYSIADIAVFPWLRSWKNQGIDWADYPHLKVWFDGIAERPAVQRWGRGIGRLAQATAHRRRARGALRRPPSTPAAEAAAAQTSSTCCTSVCSRDSSDVCFFTCLRKASSSVFCSIRRCSVLTRIASARRTSFFSSSVAPSSSASCASRSSRRAISVVLAATWRASCASRLRPERSFSRSSTYMMDTLTSVMAVTSNSPQRIWMIALVSTA